MSATDSGGEAGLPGAAFSIIFSTSGMGLAVMEELSGIDSGVVDPYAFFTSTLGGQELEPHQDAVIVEAEKLLDRIG